jgi:hypothetical protein
MPPTDPIATIFVVHAQIIAGGQDARSTLYETVVAVPSVGLHAPLH